MPSDVSSSAYWAKGMTWAPQHDELLVQKWWRDVAVVAIGESLGRTPGSVYVRAKKIGLPTKREGPLIKLVVQVTVASLSFLRSFQRVIFRPADAMARRPEVQLKTGQASRRCLSCDRMFASAWIGNRMCDACKAQGEGLI